MKLLPLVPAAALWLAGSPISAAATNLGAVGNCIYLLTANNELSAVCDTAAGRPSPPLALTGLADNDVLMAIDVRPINQEIYGLARNSVNYTIQLYHLMPATGVATPVGSAVPVLDGVGSPSLAGATRMDIDFNPANDRLRIVANNGYNLRLNPNTGALAAMDTTINGLTTTVDGCAYTNNAMGKTVTTLYTLDSTSDSLYIQSSPNGGVESNAVTVTLSAVPVNFSAVLGFDLPPGIDVPTSNVAATSGKGYAALTIGGTTGLYTVDLVTGALTSLGTPGFALRSMAVRPQIPTGIALNATSDALIRFRIDSPGTITTQAIAGMPSGETLVGLDFRPATGQLYGLGVNATANTGTLYLIDPQSGLVTAVGTAGSVAFTTSSGVAIDLPPAATGYGFAFNPTVDRIRVVTGNGYNFRVNPVTGLPVDGDTISAGTNPDGGLSGGSTSAMAAAYTNSYAGATTTTLYALDAVSDQLFIQNPPNNGTLTLGKAVTLGGSPLNFDSLSHLHITGESAPQLNSNVAEAGTAVATLLVGGNTGLYRINLLTGAATSLGSIGVGQTLIGFTSCGESSAGSAPFSWSSTAGASYRIESSTDMLSWQPLPGTVKATSTATTVPVLKYQGEPKRFWRSVPL